MRIEAIPTDQFNAALVALRDNGWAVTYVYDGWDAWIDYGAANLEKDGMQVHFEWDNWLEGIISAGVEVPEVRSVLHRTGGYKDEGD